MTDWQPLFFRPVFRDYIWGGRRLETALGKRLGEGSTWAESWEVVDHGRDQSVVAEGPLTGSTLHEIVVKFDQELLGRPLDTPGFPLLYKFLDANRPLSLQVHPNDAQAARLTPPDLGKTEAWVVLDAALDAKLYAGLKPGTTAEALSESLQSDDGAACMHVVEPRAGDCYFLPAGVPHAIGAGLLIAEIQQASNTTFRLHDWNRIGTDGRPRELHLKEGLAVIDYTCGPISAQSPEATSDSERQRLVACEKFTLDRWVAQGPTAIGGDGRFHILSVLHGDISLRWDRGERSMRRGETTLVPACLSVELESLDGPFTVLDMSAP